MNVSNYMRNCCFHENKFGIIKDMKIIERQKHINEKLSQKPTLAPGETNLALWSSLKHKSLKHY